jgi:hypothetical protein
MQNVEMNDMLPPTRLISYVMKILSISRSCGVIEKVFVSKVIQKKSRRDEIFLAKVREIVDLR